jgi:hypothetical protein
MTNIVAGDASPDAGFVVEVGGQFNAAYASLTTALGAGLALKSKDEHAQVKVYDRNERATAQVE